MNFNNGMTQGYIKKIYPDKIKAKSLIKSSKQALYSARKIVLETDTLKTILRELYEGLRQYCEAIGYEHGYKFLSHESITYFINEILKDNKTAVKFDRYRKIRNAINYYGNDISEETTREALVEIPKLIEILEKHRK